MAYLAIALLSLSQAAGNDPASWYLARTKENRQKEIEFLVRQIPLTTATMVTAKKSRMTTEADRVSAEIEDMKKRLSGLRSGKVSARVFLDPETIAVGQAGELPTSEVWQVTGPRSAIVRLKNPDQSTYTVRKLVRTEGAEAYVWVEMESTAALADRKLHDFDGLFEVVGRHEHRNKDLESVSLLLLKPFTLPPPVGRP